MFENRHQYRSKSPLLRTVEACLDSRHCAARQSELLIRMYVVVGPNLEQAASEGRGQWPESRSLASVTHNSLACEQARSTNTIDRQTPLISRDQAANFVHDENIDSIKLKVNVTMLHGDESKFRKSTPTVL